MDVTLPVLKDHRIEGANFSDQNFRSADLSGKEFVNCNFDRADLSMADCSRSSFVGCTFRKSICYRTNFMNSSLGATVFEPVDCMGMTVTLECRTFQNMQVSQQWALCWLYLFTFMLPSNDGPVKNIRDLVIGIIGAERFVKIKYLFARRDI